MYSCRSVQKLKIRPTLFTTSHACAIIQAGNLNTSSFTLYIMATFQVSATALPITRIVDLLRNPPDDHVTTLPPVKPKGGEIYIYKPKCDTEKGEI